MTVRSKLRTLPARRAPPHIGSNGLSIFAALARKTKFAHPDLCTRWTKIAGEKIAAIAAPGRIIGRGRERTLEVHVKDGAAAMLVQNQADTLCAQVNQYLGAGTVGRITIRQMGPRAISERAGPERSGPVRAGETEEPLAKALASFRSAVSARRTPGEDG